MAEKILLTGGAGFIASHLADFYLQKGFQVLIVDNLTHPCPETVNKKAIFYQIDIRDRTKLERVFSRHRPEIVNHHAALASVKGSGIDLFQVNTRGVLDLLNLCQKFNTKKFIFASSAAVYGENKNLPIKENYNKKPISEYGISKLSSEFYIKLFAKNLETVILRYANIYGPRQDSQGEGGVVSIFIDQILKGKETFIFGDGRQIRDFVFVADVARANLLALKKGITGTFNISTGKKTSVLNLYKLIVKKTAKKNTFKFGPERVGEIKESVLSNYRAGKILGWQPEINLEVGLEKTIEYLWKKF